MKLIIYILLPISILAACSNTKKISKEKPLEDVVIHDTIEISEKKDAIISGTAAKKSAIIPVREVPTTKEKEAIREASIAVITITPPPITTPPIPIKIDQKEAVDHSSFNQLLQKHVTKDGIVNYTGFSKDKNKLRDYISILSKNVPTENWNKEEKLAYWMNAYNAMTVDLILRNLPLESIKDIKDPWEQRLWKLGDAWYNLEGIEHQILRKMGDARIHFGINCASFSCPPLLNEAFTAAKVDAQLAIVAKKFINDSSRNRISENSIEVSKIFNWFAKDFKQNGNLIDYLNQYSNTQISKGAKVRYMDYNWELNK
jgi:hypothetical protein